MDSSEKLDDDEIGERRIVRIITTYVGREKKVPLRSSKTKWERERRMSLFPLCLATSLLLGNSNGVCHDDASCELIRPNYGSVASMAD